MVLELQKILDKSLGSVLLCLPAIFHSTKERPIPANMKRAAFIKLWAVGDSVVALPAIEAFKRKNPKTRVTVITRKRNLAVFENQDFIDEIFLAEPSNIMKTIFSLKKYDLVFDLEPYLNISAITACWVGKYRVGFSNQFRSRTYHDRIDFDKKHHMVEQYYNFVKHWIGNSPISNSLIPLKISRSESQVVDWFLKDKSIKGRKFIGIAPIISESVKSRQWPLERVEELAMHLTDHAKKGKTRIEGKEHTLIFFGGKSDSKTIDSIIKRLPEKNRRSMINAAGLFSVGQSALLMRHCACFISNDTGPMHIAAAMGTPTIGLFGPNTPTLWKPYGKNNAAIYHKIWCSPCIHNAKGTMPKCFNPNYQECMKRITAIEVLDAIDKSLKARRR
jgi:heptosyltransferase-2